MIVGVMQTMAGLRKKECDYLGVLYPEGYLGDEFLYGFNHVDVEEIVFLSLIHIYLTFLSPEPALEHSDESLA